MMWHREKGDEMINYEKAFGELKKEVSKTKEALDCLPLKDENNFVTSELIGRRKQCSDILDKLIPEAIKQAEE